MAAASVSSSSSHNYGFSLLSWNIDGLDARDLKVRTSTVISVIKNLLPDVLYLQEIVPTTWEILNSGLGSIYECRCANHELPYFHGVFIRKSKRIIISDSMQIAKFPHSQMLRHLLHQKVRIDGHVVHLLTSHLESMKASKDERKNQLSQCIEEILKCTTRDEVSIFGGDLNIRDEEVDAVGLPEGCADVWVMLGSDPEHQWTWDTSANNNLMVKYKAKCRFDRLYLSQPPKSKTKITPTSLKLIGKDKIEKIERFPSDHWGVLASFEIIKET